MSDESDSIPSIVAELKLLDPNTPYDGGVAAADLQLVAWKVRKALLETDDPVVIDRLGNILIRLTGIA